MEDQAELLERILIFCSSVFVCILQSFSHRLDDTVHTIHNIADSLI